MVRIRLGAPMFAGSRLRAVRRGAVRRAALAAFVWGTIAAPALHLIDHRDDHVHEAGGAIRWARPDGPPAGHHHGDGRWHTHRPTTTADEGRMSSDPALAPPGDSSPAAHGVGAAEHLGSAFLDAAPVGPAPFVFEPTAAGAIAPRPVFTSRVLRHHPSRGPPIIAGS